MGVGRIGCLIVGCCRGAPFNGPWAITYADGIPRHPAPLYEMIFDWAMGFALLALWRRHMLFGRLFALFLACYGAFRFCIEFLRETPKAYAGLSAYQLMSLAMIVAGLAAVILAQRPATGVLGTMAPCREAGLMEGGSFSVKILLRVILILLIGLFVLAGLVFGRVFHLTAQMMTVIGSIKLRLHRDIVADPVLHGLVLNLYLNGEQYPHRVQDYFPMAAAEAAGIGRRDAAAPGRRRQARRAVHPGHREVGAAGDRVAHERHLQ